MSTLKAALWKGIRKQRLAGNEPVVSQKPLEVYAAMPHI